MGEFVEINQGEIIIKFSEPTSGKLSFAELGLTDADLVLESGNLRLVIDMEGIGEHSFFRVPTVEISYIEEVAETHWVCDFNNETILDRTDHHGRSTVLLMDRKKIEELEHRRENKLVVHADFPESVHLLAADSYITLFN